MTLDDALALCDELTPAPAVAHQALQVLRDALAAERQKVLDEVQTYGRLLWLIGDIRVALGVGGKPMLFELPGVCEALRADADRYRLIRDGEGWPAAFGSHRSAAPIRGFMLDEAVGIAQRARVEASAKAVPHG